MNAALPEAFPRGTVSPRLVGTLGIAGTRVELRTDQPIALAPFLAAHRHFPAGAAGETLRVEVRAGGSHARVPRIQFPDLSTDHVRALIDRGAMGRFERLHAREGDSVVLYRDRLLDLTPAMAHGPDGCDLFDSRLLGSYLELLLLNAALDRAPCLVAAHAAVVARDGRAALICGDGGTGKTTLTLALLRRGCGYLTDEVALLDPDTGIAHAYPRSPGLREGGLALLGEIALGQGAFQGTSMAGDRKWFADPAAVAPAGVPSTARLADLWFLTGFGAEPQVSEGDPWQSARRLARSLRHARGTPIERLWTSAAIAGRCRILDVVVGPPDATAALLSRLLEGGAPIA